MSLLGLKKNLEGLWGLGLGADPGASLRSAGTSVGSTKGGRTKELPGSVVVRGEISPGRGPARLLFLDPSDFFRPRGIRVILRLVGGMMLCTTVENLNFFVVVGLAGLSDLVFPPIFGRVDFDSVGCFCASILSFGIKLKEGFGISRGNCLGFFFFGVAIGEFVLGFEKGGPSPRAESPDSSETMTPSIQL